ncbi:hypothetical protein E3G68_005158 [Mycobacteroides abscessus]|uniref:hypothetical protein n=1 Tax=Mycobacteroides abscessus TaxID=36809 RepID=UPI0018787562|nr:hypothetical protein [Mycobacteroides abscessus]
MSASSGSGYWVISVDRETGQASTSDLFDDADAAWEHSIAIETPQIYTTVVDRRVRPRKDS